MSRKQYRPGSSSHEKKVTRKERKKQRQELLAKQAEEQARLEELNKTPDITEEDTEQLKKLTYIALGAIAILLVIMYWVFQNT